MKKQTKLDVFKEILKIAIPDVEKYEFYSLKGDAFNKSLKAFSAELGAKWNENTEKPDYSIYHSEEYLIECVWTYVVSSQAAISNMLKYFFTMPEVLESSIIDVHNGIGLTTRDISTNWLGPVSYYNDCDKQIESMKRLYEGYQKPLKLDHLQRAGSYDIVVCLETIEHIKSPMMFTRRMMELANHYIVETTSFCSPQHCGHFKEYYIGSDLVTGMTASRRVHDLIRTEFEQVFSGFNGRPRIWKRKEVNKLLEM